jgi:hypothetical protein
MLMDSQPVRGTEEVIDPFGRLGIPVIAFFGVKVDVTGHRDGGLSQRKYGSTCYRDDQQYGNCISDFPETIFFYFLC